MIAAGLPYAELTEIQRNSGRIVQACAEIRDGRRFSFSPRIAPSAGENLVVVPASGDERQIEKMLRSIDLATRAGHDRVWDIQVLCPVNKKSKISRAALNRVLQAELNANPAIPNCPFRVGDKLVNTKNRFFRSIEFDATSADVQTNEKNEVYVANGELAQVLEVDGQTVIARLFNPDRTIQIYRGQQQDPDEPGQEDDDGPADWLHVRSGLRPERAQVPGERDPDRDCDAGSVPGCEASADPRVPIHRDQPRQAALSLYRPG